MVDMSKEGGLGVVRWTSLGGGGLGEEGAGHKVREITFPTLHPPSGEAKPGTRA